MKKLFLLTCLAGLAFTVPHSAQTRRKPLRKAAPKNSAIIITATPDTQIEATPGAPLAKKNERAKTIQDSTQEKPIAQESAPQKKNNQRGEAASGNANVVADAPFAYEFAQPKFPISKVVIEHDANGAGKITFEKQDAAEPVTDPLQVSAKSLEKIKALWNELSFLESSENYQTPDKDFSHLGVMKLRRSENGKTREAEFNWTTKVAAKSLTDEYKKLTEQFIWIFEMNLARENYPLNAPRLIDSFESLLRRNLVSDDKQMLPYLREVGDDERLPLIARNHAKKIAERIEKQKDEK